MGRRGSRKVTVVGDPTDPRGMAVLRDKYLEAITVKNYSPWTVERRLVLLNYFIKWCEERSIVRPGDVTKPIIDRYQRWLFHYRSPDGRPLTFQSQYGRLTPVKAWFKWLARENYILSNPASEMDLPRVPKTLPRHILTASEADQIINQPDTTGTLGVRDRAILETLYSTGLRRTETVKLKLYDLDLPRMTVMVRDGKWHKDRIVPVGQRAAVWLNKYLTEVRPMLALPKEEALFVTAEGQSFTPAGLSHLARSYVEKAELGGGKQGACHIFRHTMATLMLEGGADIRYIQAILGHADLSTTQVYTQVGIRILQQVHAATHPAGMLKPPGSAAETARTEGQREGLDTPAPLPPATADPGADAAALGDGEGAALCDLLAGEDDDTDDAD